MRPLSGSFPSGLKAQLQIELLLSIVFSVLALSVVFFGTIKATKLHIFDRWL